MTQQESITSVRFTLTEEKKKAIKRIMNKYYTPEWCDTCIHYMGCSGGVAFGLPCSNCNGGNNYEADDDIKESSDKMFEEIENIINVCEEES